MNGQLDLLDDWAAEARGAGHRIPSTVTGPDIATYREPSARSTDPQTAHQAAEGARAGNEAQVRAIRAWLADHGPATSWDIARGVIEVEGDRWQEDSLRSACARARLRKIEGAGRSPRKRPCCLYDLPR